jgi:hypothetical protein
MITHALNPGDEPTTGAQIEAQGEREDHIMRAGDARKKALGWIMQGIIHASSAFFSLQCSNMHSDLHALFAAHQVASLEADGRRTEEKSATHGWRK